MSDAAAPPLRIVHVVAAYLPAVRYGGPIYSVHGLCKSLVSLGHDVRVFTTNVDGPGVCDVPIATPVDLDGVQVTYFACPALRRICWAPALGRAVRRALANADVLHLHSVFLWPTSAAARKARELGVPYLLSPRGMLVPELIRRKSALPKLAWLNLVERHTVAGAARIHATAQAEYDDALRVFPRLPPACVIPNGIDLPDAATPLRPSDRIRDAIAKAPYALFLGRVSWKKGIERALRAMQSTDIQLVIAGNDDEGYATRLQSLAAELGIADQVRFLGRVDGDDKWALLAHARFLILPSYNENFGNVVIEALGMRCPAIVTAEVGAAQILTRAGGGAVASADALSLRETILRLWRDPEACARMGERGAAYVRENLSWRSVGVAMEREYRAVLADVRG